MTGAEIAERNTVLLVTVGSGVHGVALEGTDDHDEMGVRVEPPDHVIGLRAFEQYVFRTQPDGARSGPGDTDRVVYSLRKWARLALKGNPTVLLLLFSPEIHVMTPLGEELRAAHALFASQKAGQSFLGYLSAQKQRLLGERGQMRVHRPELVDAHGYDTKYAMHMLRLGIQGVEYMQSGAITLPIPEPEREWLRGVRRGEVGLNEVLTRVGELELELRDLIDSGPLPAEPQYDQVNEFLVSAYQRHWEANETPPAKQ
jgi:predicted nucleotidyltransferase